MDVLEEDFSHYLSPSLLVLGLREETSLSERIHFDMVDQQTILTIVKIVVSTRIMTITQKVILMINDAKGFKCLSFKACDCAV